MTDKSRIHDLAIIDKGAKIGERVAIGPFCRIGAEVTLASGVELLSHVSVQGDTFIGAECRIFPFASIGGEPQDLKYRGEKVRLEIGEKCVIREGVTINTGTAGGGGLTKIGDQCAFLANSHIAHDCLLGDNVILSNNVMIAGHCRIGDNAIFGGGSALHQFCRVGDYAFIGGLAGIEGDVLPFGMALGNRAKLAGVNLIGLKRAGIEHKRIHAVRGAFKALFDGAAPVQTRAEQLRKKEKDELVIGILDFIAEPSKRALCVPDDGRASF